MLDTIQTWYQKYRIYLLLTICIGCFVLGILLQPKQKTVLAVEEKQEPKVEQPTEIEPIKVDIKGAVVNPGVYEMKENSRVIDVIFEAGGILEDANTSRLNLSKKLEDEMTIIIYHQAEIDALQTSKIEYVMVEPECNCPDSINDACIEPPKQTTDQISLNQASLEQLQTLPGIGESKAKAIVAYREEHPFTQIEELKEIKGIGESIFEKIKDYITV